MPTVAEAKTTVSCHELIKYHQDGNGVGCVGVGTIGPGWRLAGTGDAMLDEYGPPVQLKESAISGGGGSAIAHY